jgi:hypothetical protein
VILGLSEKDYLRTFDRANLCSRKWNAREAEATAIRLCRESKHLGRVIVMLGSKVMRAFERANLCSHLEPFATEAYYVDDGEQRTRFVALPHPSGRCRAWNEPRSVEWARHALARAGVDLPPTLDEAEERHDVERSADEKSLEAQRHVDNRARLFVRGDK